MGAVTKEAFKRRVEDVKVARRMFDITSLKFDPYLFDIGGQADILSATDTLTAKRYAVKLLRITSPSSILSFSVEAKLLMRLEHPFISMGITDLRTLENDPPEIKEHLVSNHLIMAQVIPSPYIVMELIEGMDLHVRRGSGFISIKSCVEITIKICKAVSYLFSKGILHRDLTPDNVIVDDMFNPTLIDFALSGACAENFRVNPFHLPEPSAFKKKYNSIIGADEYLAPERGPPNFVIDDVRSEIYSLGAILYFLIAKRPPHLMRTGILDTDFSIAKKEDIPSFYSVGQGNLVPPKLEELVRIALEYDPKNRFQTPGEMIAALKSVLRECM
ncbi:MAG: serine/threonine-protein kinase [Candidatus Micrarchaeota archaeon]